jgi:hypothetical protein
MTDIDYYIKSRLELCCNLKTVSETIALELKTILLPLALKPFVGFGFLRQVIPNFSIRC